MESDLDRNGMFSCWGGLMLLLVCVCVCSILALSRLGVKAASCTETATLCIAAAMSPSEGDSLSCKGWSIQWLQPQQEHATLARFVRTLVFSCRVSDACWWLSSLTLQIPYR
eukprot:6476760-Amphidinium_carterae.1